MIILTHCRSRRFFSRLFFYMLFAIGVLLFLLFSTLHEKDGAFPARNAAFQNGDLVFIRGRTWRSWFVRFFDVSNDFSHVGIIRIIDGVPKVIHATPDADVVQLQNMEDFLSPANADHAGVYRLKYNQLTAEAASMKALGYFEQGISFDHRFDILCNDMLYCTELIWLAYKHSGIDLGEGEADFLYDSAPFGKVLLPGRLSKSRRLIKVEKDSYEKQDGNIRITRKK